MSLSDEQVAEAVLALILGRARAAIAEEAAIKPWERVGELFLWTVTYVSSRVVKCAKSRNRSFYTCVPQGW